MRAPHWFRNDLRLRDNPGLTEAAQAEAGLAGLFIIDPKLMGDPRHRTPRHLYLYSILQSLEKKLADRGVQLLVRKGSPEVVLPKICRELKIDLVTWTEDYSSYATERDQCVRSALEDSGIRTQEHKARVVFDYREILTQDGRPFSVYTPYWKRWLARFQEQAPRALPQPRLRGLPDLPASPGLDRLFPSIPSNFTLPPSTENAALRRLDSFLDKRVDQYHEDRDRPDLDGTSRLSPPIRFGLISPRQCVVRALDAGRNAPGRNKGVTKWINEIAWREFYAAVLATHPAATTRAIQPAYRNVRWDEDPNGLEAWKRGMTGYPIVDAGMRQLDQTGWMHNRVRMIVASFLVKDLLIDWRIGERYFFSRLLDGDPASNSGGWQWAASTGNDAAPYFRIFNPTRQGERFDPQGDYVRRWIPELEALPGTSAHRPWEAPLAASDYPVRIVDHAERRLIALDRYKSARLAFEKQSS